MEPPDPIPNSEVKRFSADGSVGSPHVRVGHCQDLIPKKAEWITIHSAFFLYADNALLPLHRVHVTKSSGAVLNRVDAFTTRAPKG